MSLRRASLGDTTLPPRDLNGTTSCVKEDVVTNAAVRHEFVKLRVWIEERLERQRIQLLECVDANSRAGAQDAKSDPVVASCAPQTFGEAPQKQTFGEAPQKQLATEVLPQELLPGVPQEPLPQDGSAHVPLAAWSLETSGQPDAPGQNQAQNEDDDPLSPTTRRMRKLGAAVNENLSVQYWQSRLMDMFDTLDFDGSGALELEELEESFKDLGLTTVHLHEVFNQVDHSGNGSIDRMEWLHMIEQASKQGSDVDAFVEFARSLLEISTSDGLSRVRRRHKLCLISHSSAFRMSWDVFMCVLLFYVAVTLPFSLGFHQIEALIPVDLACDMLFMLDIVFNFRTTYVCQADEVVVKHSRAIAVHYLKTWFFLDFVSSVPWDLVSAGIMPNMQSARLLKIGKIAKVFKLLRLMKMAQLLSNSEFTERMEEFVPVRAHKTLSRVIYLVTATMVLCHWLACFLGLVDDGSIDAYLGPDRPSSQRYLAALYWAMTTLTTVGYGDLIPKTDITRAYSMVAMIVGGSFYGYVIGCITSVVTDMDVDSRSFNDQMETVETWLDRHNHLPSILRRRVRRHFRSQFQEDSSVDDQKMIRDLSPELRADVAYFIIHGAVRRNAVFCDLPNSAMATLVDVLKRIVSEVNTTIVGIGDPGTAMYVIVEGYAAITQGSAWTPTNGEPAKEAPTADPNKRVTLREGDSFGEEIIFGIEQSYNYSVVTATTVSMYELTQDSFNDRFRNMPELRAHMLYNFMSSRRPLKA
eukprot:TRINITY_DN19528_c0_g6_i1.p1 TRINITY_DN19528_c0_g6~~TRINITY_DN19528_c0_g6_i1.p1  ORF type:complete len:753 (+),score=110.49 TRINITY_DN19528_c0_g6_i1:31-2289(+)